MVQIPQKIFKLNNPNPIVDIKLNNVSQSESKIMPIFKNDSLADKKILVVDDNNLNIKVAQRALSDFVFDVDTCQSGQERLNKINQGIKYDLILMDIMMPEMSGKTTLSKLKEIANFDTPVIALTADAVVGAKEKYLSEGFIDYIAKPFTKDQIKEKLDCIFKKVKTENSSLEDRWKDVPVYVIGGNDNNRT